MKVSNRIIAVAVAAACFSLAACHHDESEQSPRVSSADLSKAQDALWQPAWLRHHLPPHTVAYFRLPSPWGVIGAVPDGRPLDAVTAGAQNIKVVNGLRAAISKNKLIADSGAAAYVLPLLVDLRSPVEAAMIDPLGVMSPGSQVLLTMRLAQRTPAAVNARFAALNAPSLALSKPIDAHGDGMLANMVPLHFDAASGRLFALVGKPAAQPAQLSTLLVDIGKPAADSPINAAIAVQEQAIDPSGEGLFGWARSGGVGGFAAAVVPAKRAGTLPGDLISKTDAVAFGAGSVDGHGTMQLRLHAPQSRLLGYLAPRQFDPSFKVAGTPGWVANMALPDHAQWQAFENNLSLDFGAEKAKSAREAMARLKTATGFSLDELTQWIGPELIGFGDRAGTFVALRVHDRDALYTHIKTLAQRRHWNYSVRDIDGIQVHSLSTAGASDETDAKLFDGAGSSSQSVALKQLASRIGEHFYWTEDGDFLIFGKLPQALADRTAAKLDTPLAAWLTAHHYPNAHSLLGFVATTHDAQRSSYYTYLQVLQILDDMSGGAVDLSTMPAAHTLNLPRSGVVGASLDVTADTLAMRLDYEQQPLELFGAGSNGTSAVAVTAILAAVAIPAYQDYTIKTQVSEGMTLAEPAKLAVIAYRQKYNRWPADNLKAGLPAPDPLGSSAHVESITVGDDGRIVVRFGSNPPHKAGRSIAGKTLILSPSASTGTRWTWICSSDDIADKYLPAECKNPN